MTTRLEDLTSLQAKLNAATEGGRELDNPMQCAIFPDATYLPTGGTGSPSTYYAPPISTSLDAFLTLFRRVLPGGWSAVIYTEFEPTSGECAVKISSPGVFKSLLRKAPRNQLALAGCRALIAALTELEKKNGN